MEWYLGITRLKSMLKNETIDSYFPENSSVLVCGLLSYVLLEYNPDIASH